MKKTERRPGLKQAAIALALAFGTRIAWWSREFDPLVLLCYAILVLGIVGLFVLAHEMAERREWEYQTPSEDRAELNPREDVLANASQGSVQSKTAS